MSANEGSNFIGFLFEGDLLVRTIDLGKRFDYSMRTIQTPRLVPENFSRFLDPLPPSPASEIQVDVWELVGRQEATWTFEQWMQHFNRHPGFLDHQTFTLPATLLTYRKK